MGMLNNGSALLNRDDMEHRDISIYDKVPVFQIQFFAQSMKWELAPQTSNQTKIKSRSVKESSIS